MSKISQHDKRYKSFQLLLPVFLGFVILTASTNLPDFDEAVAIYENRSDEISTMDSSLMIDESHQSRLQEPAPELPSGDALGWGSRSEVLP